jgi:hypothetical protein
MSQFTKKRVKDELERETRDLSQISSNELCTFEIIDRRYGDDSMRTMEMMMLSFIVAGRVRGERLPKSHVVTRIS